MGLEEILIENASCYQAILLTCYKIYWYMSFILFFVFCFLFFIERKKETEKLAVLPKKSSARRQKSLQTEKVGG